MESKPINTKGCFSCGSESQASSQLKCEQCKRSFHKACVIPPFTETPTSAWHCHQCLKTILKNVPSGYAKGFGFEDSFTTYTLEEFGKMADTFKKTYFKGEPGRFSYSDVEKEFWNIVKDPFEHIVCVEYGADLPAKDYGSGFPTEKDLSGLNEQQQVCCLEFVFLNFT